MSDLLFDPNSFRAKDFHKDLSGLAPDAEFYPNHLNQVSRSFAACIAELESPMREWVSMTYLLCRWLDTIEDAAWTSPEAQELAFSDFVTYFEDQLSLDPNQQTTISATCTEAVLDLSNVTDAERDLIRESRVLIAKYSQFPERVREIIACLVIDMASGMSHFALVGEKLSSLRELNQYCFFVAGIVGEALTDLLDEASGVRTLPTAGAHHFGLFLQKINVLKDQFKDETEGRHFVANRAEVIESLLVDAKFAIEYIIAIPLEQKGYRTFCSWSYFLGLATLPLLEMQDATDLEPKLDRETVTGLFNLVSNSIGSNEDLLKLYFNLTDQISNFRVAAKNTTTPTEREKSVAPPSNNNSNDTSTLPTWITMAYGGRLKSEQLISLGL